LCVFRYYFLILLNTILILQTTKKIADSKNNIKVTEIQRNGFRKDQKELNNSKDVLKQYQRLVKITDFITHYQVISQENMGDLKYCSLNIWQPIK
jgi:hypothetical protein